MAAALPTRLIDASYSRDMEREADAVAAVSGDFF
jgi:Zn-dependent protease with chaperone function